MCLARGKIGSKDVESVVTNSSELARKIKSSKCSTVEEIEKLLEREVKENTEREFIKSFCEARSPTTEGSIDTAVDATKSKKKDWQDGKKGFEQHMRSEESVRLDWKTGGFEKGSLQCESCGDKNAWQRVHRCCEEQCISWRFASHD